jgi:hypothetical protein
MYYAESGHGLGSRNGGDPQRYNKNPSAVPQGIIGASLSVLADNVPGFLECVVPPPASDVEDARGKARGSQC